MSEMSDSKRYGELATAVLLLSLIGYTGNLIYPRFALPESVRRFRPDIS